MTEPDLSPRRMDFILRSRVDGTISPLDFHHPVLAAQLADALVNMSRSLSLSDGTLYQYQQSIVKMLRALSDSCPRSVGLASPGGTLIEAFHEWELALAGEYAAESNMPHRYGRRIRRLIKVHSAAGHDLNDQLLRWARGGVLHRGGENTPLDEFSNAERIAIRDACRTRIRGMEARLAIGRQLLDEGADPRATSWRRVADIVWGARHLGRTPESSIEREVIDASHAGFLDALDSGFIEDLPTTYGGNYRVMRRLMSYLYPSSEDLVAFRALLQLETGAAPEEWSTVTLDDISRTTEELRVRLYKARAHHSRSVRCTITGDEGASGWRAGDLVLRLIAATENARAEARECDSAHANSLFVTVQRSARRSLAVRMETFDRRPFATLLASITPTISQPYDARRLRKTVKSVRAAVLRSADAAAGDDHSIAVYQRHYAQSTTVHVLAGAAVNTAQQQVFDRLQGPVFVKDSAQKVADEASGLLADAAMAESEATSAQRSMNVTHCVAPYSSPHTPKGRLCEHRPSMCFACPNAIVFTDHLPRILLYREILRNHEKEMPPAQFAALHGQQLQNIDYIVNEFSPQDRENARREATALGATVHVPLSQRGVHL